MQSRKSRSDIHSLASLFALLALALSSIGVTPACAATWIVTSSANNGPGTLRTAIATAGLNDTITFDPSLSGATIYLASELVIDKGLTIDGTALASKITISGDSDGNGGGDVRVFSTSGVVAIYMKSLIIAKGYVGTFGAGIYNSISSLILTDVVLTGNHAALLGGGIYSTGFLDLLNTYVSGNNAGDSGGGIYSEKYLSLVGSTVSGNYAGNSGGGIYVAGTVYQDYVASSTVSGNYAGNSGGGIDSTKGTLWVTGSTLSGNTASLGGGISNSGTLNLTSSTLSGNFSNGNAGGILNTSSLIITNSTIAGNSANGDGGAIANRTDGTANVYNTSIVFNSADADADQNGGVAGGVFNQGTFNMRNTLIAGNSVGGVPVYDDCAGTTSGRTGGT